MKDHIRDILVFILIGLSISSNVIAIIAIIKITEPGAEVLPDPIIEIPEENNLTEALNFALKAHIIAVEAELVDNDPEYNYTWYITYHDLIEDAYNNGNYGPGWLLFGERMSEKKLVNWSFLIHCKEYSPYTAFFMVYSMIENNTTMDDDDLEFMFIIDHLTIGETVIFNFIAYGFLIIMMIKQNVSLLSR